MREVGREQQLGSGSRWKLVSGGSWHWKELELREGQKPHVTPHQSSLSGVVRVNPQCNVVGRFKGSELSTEVGLQIKHTMQ